MGTENLTRLRDFLRTLDDEQVRMEWWAIDAYGGRVRVENIDGPASCGTAGCAAGWTMAALMEPDYLAYAKTEKTDREWANTSTNLRLPAVANYLGLERSSLFFTDEWPATYGERARHDGEPERVVLIDLISDILTRGEAAVWAEGTWVEYSE